MHEPEVDVIDAQVLQRRIELLLHVVGVVCVVPELGGDEDLVTRHTAVIDTLANSLLGAVDARSVDVAVASLQSDFDGVCLRIGVLPRTEANSGNLGARVESKHCAAGGHSDCGELVTSGYLVLRCGGVARLWCGGNEKHPL